MAEYGIVLAVITVGALAAFTALSGGIKNAINNIVTML
jgi:Flp pilus assembly pilin Flp